MNPTMLSRSADTEVITSIEAFEALAHEWPALEFRRFGPLTSHEWFSCAARAFCIPDSLHVIVYRRAGVVAAVAPLFKAARHGIEWLELIGASALFEPSALPATDEDALGVVCTAMFKQARPVFLQRLDPKDACIRLLKRSAQANGKLRALSKPGSCFLTRGTSWAEVRAAMPARRWKKLSRMRDELNQRGAVTLEAVAPGPQETAVLFQTVMKVEAAGWKGRAGSALLVNSRVRRFFEELAMKFAHSGELRVFVLRLDGDPIAVQLGIEQGGRYWALKRGFDEAWRRYSPGILLTSDAIAHMLDRHRAGYEFLGSPEDWQRQWAPQERALCALALYPRGVRGGAAYITDTLFRIAQRSRRYLRGAEGG